MGHRKKVFTALFVIFAALVSSVAGGFALMNPARISSNAKSGGDDAILDLKFYKNGGIGTVNNIYKVWPARSKSDASSTITQLKVPDSQEGNLVFKHNVQVRDKSLDRWVNDSDGGHLVEGYRTEEQDVFDSPIVFSFHRPGYVFTEWVEGNESGPNYEQGAHYAVGTNLANNFTGSHYVKHLWAVWAPILFNITFVDNTTKDDKAKPITITVTERTDITYTSNTEDSDGLYLVQGTNMPQNTVSRPGKTFLGWTNTATYDTGSAVREPGNTLFYARELFPNSIYTLNTEANTTGRVHKDTATGRYIVNETMYAVWENTRYEVNFDMGGHGSNPGSMIYAGNKLHLPTPENDPEGYTFKGWHYETASGPLLPQEPDTPAGINAGFYFIPDSYIPEGEKTRITICAVWGTNSVTVIYDSGGADQGGAAPPLTTFTTGVQIAFPAHTWTKAGSEFLGWDWNNDTRADWTQAMGSLLLTQISLNAAYTTGGKIELTACWSTNTVTVEWYYNNNLDQCVTDTIAYGQTASYSNPPNKDGYIFKGWSTTSSGDPITDSNASTGYTTVAITPVLITGTTYAVTKYYAIFEITSVTVTYNLNIPAGAVVTNAATFTPQAINYGQTVKTHRDTPLRADSTFIGWAETAAATHSQITYNPNETITHQESVTLYAVWTARIYTITLNPNIPQDAVAAGYAANRQMDYVYLKYGAANNSAWYSRYDGEYTVTDLVTSSNHAKATCLARNAPAVFALGLCVYPDSNQQQLDAVS